MALTPEQLEARKKYLGSSDASAVLGLDPFRTAHDVYLEKTGKCEPWAGNEATDRGRRLEPVVLDWAAEQLKATLTRDVFASLATKPLCANLDAICPGEFIVEAKTSTNSEEFGEDGSDQVPERVIVQTHQAMYVTGLRLAYVPVLLPIFGRFEFRMYRVERNDELCAEIAARGCEFWSNHVLADVPPANCLPSLETLKRMRRMPDTTQKVDDALVDAWLAANETRKHWEKIEESTKSALITAFGSCDGGECGRGLITFFEYTRNEKAREARQTKYRQLRLKAAK